MNHRLPALDFHYYRAVLFVYHPSGKPQGLGQVFGRIPESYALHPAVEDQALSYICHTATVFLAKFYYCNQIVPKNQNRHIY